MIIGVEPFSLLNFRGDLIKRILSEGHRVIALACGATPEQVREIEALGCTYINYDVERTGLNPLRDLRTLGQLIRIVLKNRPSHVLAYTIKPVIWAGIALWFFRSVKFIPLITGLGYAFNSPSTRGRIIRSMATVLYKGSLSRADTLIFQNKDNLETFASLGIISSTTPRNIVNGSGVNTRHFAFHQAANNGTYINFLMIARLLRDKGVLEYLHAARAIRCKWPRTEFLLVGPEDSSPNAVPKAELESFIRDGTVTYLGEALDVRAAIQNCHVFVLPSYHEGVPRTVLEAMSIGRPILTTDVSGCRETVVASMNGWLVPAADTAALEEKMSWFIKNSDEIQAMGLQSRRYVEQRFDVEKVNLKMIDILSGV